MVEGHPARRRFTVTAPVLVVALLVALGSVGCDRGSDPAQDPAATGFRADVTAVADDGRARVDVVLDEPGASIDRVVDDEVVDTVGDGEPDTWRIGIAVEVVEPGSYRLNVDLADAEGARVLSATGTGELDPGPGLIDVEVPVEVVERLDVAGPSEVVDATLSHGNGAPIRAASRSSVGTVATPQW